MLGGKACCKQATQYTGKQSDEGSVVTSRDTTAPENKVHSSGHTHRKSMILTERQCDSNNNHNLGVCYVPFVINRDNVWTSVY